MKKKVSIFVVLMILFGVLGIGADGYMRQQDHKININDQIAMNYLQRSIPATAMMYSRKNDPNTEILHLVSDTTDVTKSFENIYQNIEYRGKNFVADPAVNFWLVDKESGRVIDGSSQETYDQFKVNPQGWHQTFDSSTSIMNFMKNDHIIYDFAYSDSQEYTEASYTLSDQFYYVYNIQNDVMNGQVSSLLSDLFPTIIEAVQEDAGVAVGLGSLIIAIVLLVLPIEWVTLFPLYQGLWNTKMEWSLIIIAILTGGSITAAMVLSPYFYWGTHSLTVINSLPISLDVFQKTGPLWWVLAFLLISTSIFYVKRVLTFGIFKSYKEKSYGGSFLRWIKHRWQDTMAAPIHNDIKKRVTYIAVVNFIVIFVCLLFGPFGFVLAIVYTIASTSYALHFIHTIQMDYNTMHQQAQDIAQGKFNTETHYYTGLFQPISSELNTINASFDLAVKEAMASQYTKAELITNVSHDLKTPLTGIRNYTELLQDPNLSEVKRHEYLERMNNYTVRMTKLIEDLFEISKATANDIKLERQNLNINHLVDQVLLENTDALEAKKLEVVKVYDGIGFEVYLDAEKTYRLFDNLIQNISKYAMQDTRVYVDVTSNDESVKIELKNISKDPLNFDAKEIQERFIRGDKSRSEEGSGLGLAIAEKFTTLQDGSFEIQIDGDLFKAIVCFPLILK